MARSALLFLLLVGCSGSAATVSDSASDIREAPPVEPTTPPGSPVDPTTTLECTTSEPLSDGSAHTIRFSMHGDVLAREIAIDPPSSVLAPLTTNATLEKENGKLVLAASEQIELALFENSDLTRGYVKAGDEYSDVYCSKR